eukprot:CAMPEP_0115472732 /NCGR_PEP_ID=MMETSP0271-20121206/53200_1 /TAXON_ID=71861 /ORGANISM="Scrippsiella trochoidea, Strain CCMP3099" /LENGTH=284 /DNA_ID=CAMNT_0002899977 /DNA_START=12 /DNA_END=866 /DNA_ORIENTATION=-
MALVCHQPLPMMDPARDMSMLPLSSAANAMTFRPPAEVLCRAGMGHSDRPRRQPMQQLVDNKMQRSATAVAIDDMGRKQHYQRTFDQAYYDVAMERNLRRIKTLFQQADADNSGCLNLEELHAAMMHPQMKKTFAAVGIQPHQADIVFEAMDSNGDGEINLKEFMDGLRIITGPSSLDGFCPDLDVKKLLPANRRKYMEASRDQLLLERPASAPTPPGGRRASAQAQDKFFRGTAQAKALIPANRTPSRRSTFRASIMSEASMRRTSSCAGTLPKGQNGLAATV